MSTMWYKPSYFQSFKKQYYDIMTQTCQLCGFNKQSSLEVGGINIEVCDVCSFVTTKLRPNIEESKEPEFVTEKEIKNQENSARIRCSTLVNYFENDLYTSSNKVKKILEVNCGVGSFLRLIRASGWKVAGLEPNATYSKMGRARYNIPINNQSLEDFDSEKCFDLICSFDTIARVANPNDFLTNIHRFLLDEGYLYLENLSVERLNGNTIDLFFNNFSLNTFSLKTLKAFLAKNQFLVKSSGWNGNGLWIIAQKTEMQNLPVNYDNPQRIRRIVRQATLLNKVVSSNSMMKRTSSVFTKGSSLIKNNPSQIPSRVKNKIQRRFKISNDFSILGERLLNAEKVAIKPLKANTTNTLKVVHVGIHENTNNAGDTLLFPAIRWLWQKHLAPTNFTLSCVRGKVTQATIDEINQHDALIIGGGGLFLADTNANNISGWQWACSTELLDKIKVPIILFAVGYNRFRGQEEFKPVFTENLCKLIEKSIFVGLRNYGSIEAIKQYLPESLHHKLAFQPCPTTLLSRFYPNIPSDTESKNPIVSVNIAFDRHHLRFGHREDEILWGIADSLLLLQEKGWQPVLFNHSTSDRDAHLWFKARGLHIDETNLFWVSPQTIINQYSRVSLALGMRGHAQMIPFGLNCPILSLISHNKLGFFLDDIGHNEWGLELKEGETKNNLTVKIDYFINNQDKINLQVQQAQEKLWQITQRNLEFIEKNI